MSDEGTTGETTTPSTSGAGPSGLAGRPAGVPRRRSSTALFTGGLVGVVLIIVVVLVVLKLTGSTPPAGTAPPAQPLPASTAQQVTTIPSSVYNTVGIDSPTVSVTPPRVVQGQPALTLDGEPGFLYVGGEFCPFCGAQRWAITAALARFGKFTGLQTMQSSATDAFGSVQTLTFAGADFSSPYITAALKESYGNQHNSSGTGWAALEVLTPVQQNLVAKYDVAKYTGVGSGTTPSMPFVDIGNKLVAGGASFSPSILQGLSRNEIAAGLTDPTDPVTQAIVASANYLSAGVCGADGERPAAVCTSKGVVEAARALGLRP